MSSAHANSLLTQPPLVVVYDPRTATNLRTYCFLGDVPRNVAKAVSTNNKQVLEDYYGTTYKKKLGMSGVIGGMDTDIPKDVFHYELEYSGGGNNNVINGAPPAPKSAYIRLFGKLYDPYCVRAAAAKGMLNEIYTHELSWILQWKNLCELEVEYPISIKHKNRIYTLLGHDKIKDPRKSNDIVCVRMLTLEQLEKCCIEDGDGIEYPVDTVDTIYTGAGDDNDTWANDIESLLNEVDKEMTLGTINKDKTKHTATKTMYVAQRNLIPTLSFEPGVEYVSNISIYPEDKYFEIMEKIYLATGIPTYRQHLFYTREKRAITTYTLYSDGIYNIDIRDVSGSAASTATVNGLPIDRELYDNRENVSIHAHDTFMTLNSTCMDSTQSQPVLYVVDLALWLAPMRSQLEELISDQYQFDIIYYGFIMKYWPRLTKPCFHDYVVNESDLYSTYPDLARYRMSLASMYNAERDILNAQYKILHRARANAPLTIAIAQMTAHVSKPQVVINIRNLFDKLRTGQHMPEIHARVDHNGKQYLLKKRYLMRGIPTQKRGGGGATGGYSNAPVSKFAPAQTTREIVFPTGLLAQYGIVIACADSSGAAPPMFLNVLPNGKYYIKAQWPEEANMTFDSAVEAISKRINPIIDIINSHGYIVFSIGKSLPHVTKYNIEYQGINVHIFWKKVMLESAFRQVKSLLDQYVSAGIITPRSAATDYSEFMWRKGMYQFDNSIIDKILHVQNQYRYLSDNTVKQKWIQQYSGRIVRMIHRTTDVKFEIMNIRETEFHIIHDYIAAFVYGASSIAMSRVSTVPVKKLRKLREHDPELFNIKKYGTAKVYSRICQKKQQPAIYTQDEVDQMTTKDLSKLTKYHNFTLNKPAYYGCPNRKYPHLSFIVGVHPKHYCLPCCNKKSAAESGENKKLKITNTCLAEHMFIASEDSGELSRHIIRYGKPLDVGRLSKLPAGNVSTLFLSGGTGSTAQYYVYGVPQYIPGVPAAGIIFAIATALGMTHMELLAEISQMLEQSRRTSMFHSLLSGTIVNLFANVDDLIAELTLSNNLSNKLTPELIIELVYLMNITTYMLIDEDASGSNVDLFLPEYVDVGGGSGRGSAHARTNTNLIIMKVTNKYYPVFIIDIDKYFKTGAVISKTYLDNHEIMGTLVQVVHHGRKTDGNVLKLMDYTAVIGSGVKILTKYVNRQGQCYAVLAEVATATMYIPIDYSINRADGVKLCFDQCDIKDITATSADVLKFMEEFTLAGYKKLVPRAYVETGGIIIGIITTDNMIFYYSSSDRGDLPKLTLTFDPIAVNSAILNNLPPTKDKTSTLSIALYTNFMYQMFIIEFSRSISSERNEDIRSKLIDLINATNFKRDIASFRAQVRKLIGIDDIRVLREQINNAYQHNRTSGAFDKAALVAQIKDYSYDFDKLTARRLQELYDNGGSGTHSDKSALYQELTNICGKFAVDGDVADIADMQAFPNVHLSCVDGSSAGFCSGKKLIVKDLSALISLLAADLSNSIKRKYILSGMFLDITIDYFDFEKYPLETITIVKL